MNDSWKCSKCLNLNNEGNLNCWHCGFTKEYLIYEEVNKIKVMARGLKTIEYAKGVVIVGHDAVSGENFVYNGTDKDIEVRFG